MNEASQPDAVPASGRPAFRADPSHRLVPDDSQARAASLFKQIPLFREVPPHHLRDLARFAQVEMVPAGEEIIRMGEFGSTMYVIVSGRVNVVRERPSGDALLLASLGP